MEWGGCGVDGGGGDERVDCLCSEECEEAGRVGQRLHGGDECWGGVVLSAGVDEVGDIGELDGQVNESICTVPGDECIEEFGADGGESVWWERWMERGEEGVRVRTEYGEVRRNRVEAEERRENAFSEDSVRLELRVV